MYRHLNFAGLQQMVSHYFATAAWVNEDDTHDRLDEVPDEVIRDNVRDVLCFWIDNYDDLLHCSTDWEQHGHDFYLTRNGHGTGFWDRGYDIVGHRLTRFCQTYGPTDELNANLEDWDDE